MPQFDEKHVKINDCIVVWDAMNKPDEPNSNGNIRRGFKVVTRPDNPDLPLLQQLADTELRNSKFQGILPQGGLMPIGTVGQTEFNGMYPGWAIISCYTFKFPDVYDEAGQVMVDPMQYLPMVYPGQYVDILVNCQAYDNKSKGVAARMDGFSIKVSANAQRLSFGGGGIDTSGAFGNQNNGGGQGYNQNQNNGGGQGYSQNQNNGGGQNQNNGGQGYNQNQNNGGGQNQNQNNGGGQNQNQNNGGGQNQNQNNGGGQGYNQNQNNGGYNQNQNNGGGGAQQAHNYLPDDVQQ